VLIIEYVTSVARTISRTVAGVAIISLVVGCAQPGQQSSSATSAASIPIVCENLATALTQLNATRLGAARLSAVTTEALAAGNTVPGPAPNQMLPAPAHCKLTGKLNERIGADGKPYAIGFEMRLPTQWNGRFYFQANGGNDGVVQPALGKLAVAPVSALELGYAVLSSDAGHTLLREPALGLIGGNVFGLDPQARRDYGYSATAALAPWGKDIIRAHYGRAPQYSYLLGCSNGGRHAMVAASRYPEMFDGIVAGNPGFNLPKSAVQHAWDIQALASVNPARPALAFPPADMKLVQESVLKSCDALDGLADGLVFDLKACQGKFKLASLQCSGAKTESCLSEPQVKALDKMFAGPKNSRGEALYSDWPFDGGIGSSAPGFSSWRSWKLEGPIAGLPIIGSLGGGSLAYIFSTPPVKVGGAPPQLMAFLTQYNFDTDAPKINATDATFGESAMSFMTPPNPSNLSALQSRGAKLLVYHGASDGVFSVNDTINWYDRLTTQHGAATAAFARLFTVPGMNHCAGGPTTDRFDALAAISNWVERGQAPDQMLANVNPANTELPANWPKDLTRPLCAYPKVARYRGSGALGEANSFECR
jgi:pimeloyl-ACP methyl ester carboxylesterase